MDKSKPSPLSAPETGKLTPHAKKPASRAEGTDLPMSSLPPPAMTDLNEVSSTGQLSSNPPVSGDAQQAKTNTERKSRPNPAQSHRPTTSTQRPQQPVSCPSNACWTRALVFALLAIRALLALFFALQPPPTTLPTSPANSLRTTSHQLPSHARAPRPFYTPNLDTRAASPQRLFCCEIRVLRVKTWNSLLQND
jgi:hypothetical protein